MANFLGEWVTSKDQDRYSKSRMPGCRATMQLMLCLRVGPVAQHLLRGRFLDENAGLTGWETRKATCWGPEARVYFSAPSILRRILAMATIAVVGMPSTEPAPDTDLTESGSRSDDGMLQ